MIFQFILSENLFHITCVGFRSGSFVQLLADDNLSSSSSKNATMHASSLGVELNVLSRSKCLSFTLCLTDTDVEREELSSLTLQNKNLR